MTVVITLMNQLSAVRFELDGAGDGRLCSPHRESCWANPIGSRPGCPLCRRGGFGRWRTRVLMEIVYPWSVSVDVLIVYEKMISANVAFVLRWGSSELGSIRFEQCTAQAVGFL